MSEAKQETRSLVKKLSEVKALVGRIRKSGRNEFHRYDYVMEADVLDAVRHEMAERQLVLFPSADNVEFAEVATKDGKPQRLCTVTATFTVEDGESGETRSFKMLGQGMDQGDKAFYKAMTGAEKYAVLKLFMISTGDDPEQDSPERRVSSKATTRTQQLKAELGAKASAGLVSVGFGTHKSKPADSLTVLELTDAVAEGRTALEKNPSAKWAPKLKANIEMLQRALDGRMEPSDEKKAEILGQEGAGT